MQKLHLKPKTVKSYYDALGRFRALEVSHETAVRDAFQDLLKDCGRQFGWTLVAEWPIKRAGRMPLRADGALVDQFRLRHGLWEAKDDADDLRREAKKKRALGYPSDNILFQSPERAILYQNGREVLDADITDADALARTLERFFEYQPPAYEQWEHAVEDFQTKIPEFGRALTGLIEKERRGNKKFSAAFTDFYELCRQSVNPNLSENAVEEMLIQHLLTERIFRTVFNNPDFRSRNVIAREIERVIDALTSQSFSRDEFLRRFDYFYRAVEETARTIEDFAQKQEFLNAVYERFFRGFSVKVADTHGIVYTPPSVVTFMVRSVGHLLRERFGKSLGSRGVHILDPFVGTGNFIVHCMQEIKRTQLEQKYAEELHCNEVMLLPYYVASMNIEHEYYELTGRYEPFGGICLVDTFELAEDRQMSFFSTENTDRVERQKRSPITVVIGNPPYNAWQLNENDNNKNRKYKEVDRRVAETYAKDSKATNKNSLSDPYVKAIRWASDRIGEEGIVSFITNNSFIENLAFDGVRKNLEEDFDEIYVLDLGGNVRKNPKLSGTTHNVFGIQVGVSVNIFVRRRGEKDKERAKIFYAHTDEFWRKGAKYKFLDEAQHVGGIEWQELQPDEKHNWLTEGMQDDYRNYISLGEKKGKSQAVVGETIFNIFSGGVKTNRDVWVYNFNEEELENNIKRTIDAYNEQVLKWNQLKKREGVNVDDFAAHGGDRIPWSRDLKLDLQRGRFAEFSTEKIRNTLYRPFTKSHLFFERIMNEEVYGFPAIFPNPKAEDENRIICLTGIGSEKPFLALVSDKIADLHLSGPGCTTQCFSFYIYDEDGTNRRENVTDWALAQFRERYGDEKISKWDIFHYVYALLHHPAYRERYAANLKRELPRVPFAPDFKALADAGARLAELHVNYEQQPEFPLERIESANAALDWRVERMRLDKDRRQIIYNDFLTLSGVPPETFEYRLGNRSALEWVIDQYQLTTDRRSGIANDPNRADDPQYILRLVAKVITVSLETTKIVRELPDLGL
ncbi:MAG TPA: type ISP restriction/modification enzyme [Pyrinomonadaceae bacterium]|nr:type ISP restriction/modification enzyme [Pyrinomonadaceae bacterium]